MPPETARMSRSDRRAKTVADLVTTARTAFLRDGYAATSLDAIAEAAGYSKGAVYSNFKDKPTLCRAVLVDIHDEKMAEIADLAPGDGEVDPIRFVDGLADWLRRSLGDMEWTMLEFEYAALARNNPDVKESIATLRYEISETIASQLTRVFGDSLAISDAFGTPHDIADLILSTGIGLSVQRAIDPRVSVEPAISILTAVAALLHEM
ncbi:TetR/AcrR family transcriptional regulator [Gordonia sp. (in: high G+C Gram-positive bacteria)]|jgi:AcrR family transcriptional regulator|uniref:TetR/AcrR family transcriptional regulator n=1 Tax=Gordonia sp. (in: high G+C Gram-positive bacteria) TaxID=84139 RepID=UPI00333FED81